MYHNYPPPPKKNNATDRLAKTRKLIVFDVGANIGNYTKEVLNQYPNCIVFAFEPSATARSTFLAVHKHQSNVHLEPFGFYNEVSSKTLYSNYPGSAISSLTKRNLQHFGSELGCKERVKLNTIDNYCQEYMRIPDLLKIDVEGHEMDVLKGAMTTIKKLKSFNLSLGVVILTLELFFKISGISSN